MSISRDESLAAEPYLARVRPTIGRALSRIDTEITSSSRGSFDRTWWAWKFTDFSAPRFQEGAYTLAWLYTSPLALDHIQNKTHLLEAAMAAFGFWRKLQHADGSFDEAYPLERSLAATAFTGFYVGAALERLRKDLPPATVQGGLDTVERLAVWLSRNSEYHGVLSNHLAAAAAALQVAGDIIGTDRFLAARDRFLSIIAAEQDSEGWMREYAGADPGYQSHGMFYLADIWRRTGDTNLLDRLQNACEFMAWFAHPDGTFGGEYTSRGTKFAYPAAFEILACQIPAAASVAAHLRSMCNAGRGIGPGEVDSWNLFPMLNNFLFAADAATTLPASKPLPTQVDGSQRIFTNAGLAVARRGRHVLAIGAAFGGALKLWNAETGDLVYEDCGYAVENAGDFTTSQGLSEWRPTESAALSLAVVSAFGHISSVRFDPYRFVAFRCFTLTIGRIPAVARWLKNLLVATLISKRTQSTTTLNRRIDFKSDGSLHVEDRLQGVTGQLSTVARQVPFHMGSARYTDARDFLGASLSVPPVTQQDHVAQRSVYIDFNGRFR